jgi:hypothetical protein
LIRAAGPTDATRHRLTGPNRKFVRASLKQSWFAVRPDLSRVFGGLLRDRIVTERVCCAGTRFHHRTGCSARPAIRVLLLTRNLSAAVIAREVIPRW